MSRIDQIAMAGNPTTGSSLKAAMVSSVRHAAGALDDPRRLSDRRWRQARWSWRTLLYRRGRNWRIPRGGKIQEPPSINCVSRRRLRNRTRFSLAAPQTLASRPLRRLVADSSGWTNSVDAMALCGQVKSPRSAATIELRRLVHTNVWVRTTNARPTPTNVR
jgi:hypothetical protein